MLIARTRDELAQMLRQTRAPDRTLTLVPTMGALHDGHLSLIDHARAAGGAVAASIFINPLQFGPAEDLGRYPRDEAGDLAQLHRAGCDLVWLPGLADMYPVGDATRVEPGGPALGWEGDLRPGHFRGVATVVTKLFGQCKPDAACFGEKDWQQLQVIRRVAADLALGVRIVGVPTMREIDGLAMSSRNRFLTDADRARAPLLHAALQRASADLLTGAEAATTLMQARAGLEQRQFVVEYLALVAGATLREIAAPDGAARLICAARLGSVRLIDNIAVS